MPNALEETTLDALFLSARSTHAFTPEPVADATLERLYDLLKWGPTSFNAQPARYVFIRSAEAKARLLPALSASNRDKTARAPITAIVAYDSRFYEHLSHQLPGAQVAHLFAENAPLAEITGIRNGTLQGAHLLIAARALGLAVGPMSGFDQDAINREFFPDGRFRANFLVNIGYADGTVARPRGPRLSFADVVQVL